MSLINRSRYAFDDKAQRDAIVERARAQLAEHGSASFPAFVTPEALAEMVGEASAKFDRAYRRVQSLGINPQGRLAEIADQALLARRSRYSMWILGSDLLDADSAIRRLYCSADLTDLVRDALGIATLHPTADPLINVNVTYMGEGDQHGWHFDGNDFVVSLLLQAPHDGGAFEYAPEVEDAPLDDVHRILDGTSDRVRLERVEPGTLLLFRGRRALHRVTPVSGGAMRMIALLSYHTLPGFIYPDDVKQNGLGRVDVVQG